MQDVEEVKAQLERMASPRSKAQARLEAVAEELTALEPELSNKEGAEHMWKLCGKHDEKHMKTYENMMNKEGFLGFLYAFAGFRRPFLLLESWSRRAFSERVKPEETVRQTNARLEVEIDALEKEIGLLGARF